MTATAADTELNASNSPRRLGHVPALTGLRAIAVLMVLVHHSTRLLPRGVTDSVVWDPIMGCFLGVDLFFALSGFLITSLLLEERSHRSRVNLRNFYARRALRLLPALYVMLATFAVFSIIDGLDWAKTRATIGWAVVYATNIQILRAPGTFQSYLGQLWSLAIEEQFYIVFPVILIAATRKSRQATPLIVGLLTAAYVIALHRYALYQHGVGPVELRVRLDTRADTLLIGAAGGVAWHFRALADRWMNTLGWMGAIGFALCVANGDYNSAFWNKGGFDIVASCATAMILAAASGRWTLRHILGSKPLLVIGLVSYGLYLWHFWIFKAIGANYSGWPAAARVGIAYALAAAATAASWFLVERPANRIKRRFARPGSTAPAAGPPAV